VVRGEEVSDEADLGHEKDEVERWGQPQGLRPGNSSLRFLNQRTAVDQELSQHV
jgi:hypothetical protein